MKLEDLIEDLKVAAVASEPRRKTKALMDRVFADPAQVKAMVPDFAEDDVVLFEDETVSIWFCRFQPGATVPPHDHQMSVFIGVFEGEEHNIFYEKAADGGLQKSSDAKVGAGQVLAIGPSAIHAVSCSSPQPSQAIHVYLGALTKVERSLLDLENQVAMPFTDENYYKLVS